MELSVDEQRLKAASDLLPEHHRRWNAGALASSLPHGGVKRVSQALGISRKTVARGMREISQPELIDATRVRRAGGGRKDRLALEPEIGLAFDSVVESCTAGDPMDDEAKWVSMGRNEIARAMEGILGHGVSPYYVGRLLSQKGFRRRKMAKCLPLRQAEERDEQFRNIERLRREYRDEGLPVISVDTKKKEMLGDFYREGRCFCRQARKVFDHDFLTFSAGMVTPHGVYDIGRNEGYLTCATTAHDTCAFNVDCIEHWWYTRGVFNYGGCRRLLILADGGGSNSSRNRRFREELQALADRTGLEIRVAHYPPYTSKWNPIEHRFFCHISRAWRGKVFKEAVDMLMPAVKVTTRTGLSVFATVSTRQYEKGLKVSDSFLRDYPVIHDDHLGKWNYVVKPRHGAVPASW